MPDFSSSKIISHRFHVDDNEGESGFCYDMIIYHDLMVQLGLLDGFRCQVLQWGGTTVPMKEPCSLIGQTYLPSFEMRDVVMQTKEPVSTR